MALGYGPWCQDHPAVIKDQASPVSACHASGAAVADVLPRCEIGSRPAVPSPDGCRAVGLPHRHRMPAAALEKGLLPTGRRRPRRGAHLGWLRPGLGPAAQPCAHPDRRCPQIPCPPMIRSVRTLASEWCAGRHVPAYPTRRPLRGSLNRQDATGFHQLLGDYLRDLTAWPQRGGDRDMRVRTGCDMSGQVGANMISAGQERGHHDCGTAGKGGKHFAG